MKKVKITVIRKVNYADLSARYENPMEHTCDMQEGQIFISAEHDAVCDDIGTWGREFL